MTPWRDGEHRFVGESDLFKRLLAGCFPDAREPAASLASSVNAYERRVGGRWTLGDAVANHHLNFGCRQQRRVDQVVTCHERRRMFERG